MKETLRELFKNYKQLLLFSNDPRYYGRTYTIEEINFIGACKHYLDKKTGEGISSERIAQWLSPCTVSGIDSLIYRNALVWDVNRKKKPPTEEMKQYFNLITLMRTDPEKYPDFYTAKKISKFEKLNSNECNDNSVNNTTQIQLPSFKKLTSNVKKEEFSNEVPSFDEIYNKLANMTTPIISPVNSCNSTFFESVNTKKVQLPSFTELDKSLVVMKNNNNKF